MFNNNKGEQYPDLSYNKLINIISWLKYYNKGDLSHLDSNNINKLIIGLFSKNCEDVSDALNIENLRSNKFYKNFKKNMIYNLTSRFIFFVPDISTFIESLKTNMTDLNQGSQKNRGRISYISHILNTIDKDFRMSMFNHNRVLLEEYGLKNDKRLTFYIPKSCFSFKNIHINLGNTKW